MLGGQGLTWETTIWADCCWSTGQWLIGRKIGLNYTCLFLPALNLLGAINQPHPLRSNEQEANWDCAGAEQTHLQYAQTVRLHKTHQEPARLWGHRLFKLGGKHNKEREKHRQKQLSDWGNAKAHLTPSLLWSATSQPPPSPTYMEQWKTKMCLSSLLKASSA